MASQQPQGYHGAPIQQTTIVMQQPAGHQTQGRWQPGREPWTTGICGCFEDIGTCCIGWFCPMFLACQIANQMRETCCIVCCVPNVATVMRTKLRTVYDIEGSICCDCMAFSCCGTCALCQMAREMKNRGM